LSDHSHSQRAPISISSEFYTSDAEWSQVKVISDRELQELKEKLPALEKDVSHLKDNQPKCSSSLKTYDKNFDKYFKKVEKVLHANECLRYKIQTFLFSPEKISELQKTIDKLSSYVENNNWVYNRVYFGQVIERLEALKDEQAQSTDKLYVAAELGKISKTLEQNDCTLQSLLEPTHSWVDAGLKDKRCVHCNRLISEKEYILSYGGSPPE
jgi:predicted RNase H-like nuclease (RuvC/YqgF family)